MFNVIIPLRANSKGIKNKNILRIQKDILINFLLKKIIKIKLINKIFILTDSNYYKKKILKHPKINLDYIRPKNLSRDNSSVYDLIYHFLIWAKKKEIKIDKLVLMQATSPMITKKEILQTLKFIKKKKINSLIHVCETINHPSEMIKGNRNNWSMFLKNKIINRQNYIKNVNFITGSLYFFSKKFFLKNKSTFNNSSYAYKVGKINFIDIDDRFDYELAKKLLT